LGVPVYYADERAKYILNNDADIINRVKNLLGESAYINDELNRTYIASKVFNNVELLKQYNSIIHPAVAEDSLLWLKEHDNAPYTLREAALLVETGSYKFLDKLIVVTAPIETRIDRVILRDKVSREEVNARIKNQMPDEEKIKLADFVVNNSGKESIIHQVFAVHNKLLALSKSAKI
jgi:dephospho-CoA kinase